MELASLVPDVIEIARASGQTILDIYQNGQFDKQVKSDNTPVTTADLAAHQLISERLTALTPAIPVLSEEAASIPLQERQQWQKYWLVDPLDGTKEFIAGSGDFATIIALVRDNQPILGVVYAPVTGVVYYAAQDEGAWKLAANSHQPEPMHIQRHQQQPETVSIAISREQKIPALMGRLGDNFNYEFIPLGSAALKSCLVADGGADCYLRLGPTGEWDTAATQCIVEQAGGRILNTHLDALSYNQRHTLENPNFIAIGDTDLPWSEIVVPDDHLIDAD